MALGICRLLKEDIDRAKSYLKKFYLNYEIIYFAAKHMNRNEMNLFERALIKLIQKTKKKSNLPMNTQLSILGCNAVNLLCRMKGVLPGKDWSNLILDNADLSEIDLSGKCFNNTSLRFANLDNTNLEESDFRNSDLTGVLIEETEGIKLISGPLSTDKLYIIYDDGIIREWNIQSPRIPHPKKLYQIDFKGIENITLLEFPKNHWSQNYRDALQ